MSLVRAKDDSGGKLLGHDDVFYSRKERSQGGSWKLKRSVHSMHRSKGQVPKFCERKVLGLASLLHF